MSSFTVLLACLLLAFTASAAEPIMRTAPKSACVLPSEPKEPVDFAVSRQAADIASSSRLCSYRNTCRGWCLTRGQRFCLRTCHGCTYCKGCNERGVCDLKKPCLIVCTYYPCRDVTICKCEGQRLNCGRAPIRPWCKNCSRS